LATIGVSYLAFRLIEKPGMELSITFSERYFYKNKSIKDLT